VKITYLSYQGFGSVHSALENGAIACRSDRAAVADALCSFVVAGTVSIAFATSASFGAYTDVRVLSSPSIISCHSTAAAVSWLMWIA
jgi:hypothetical protein